MTSTNDFFTQDTFNEDDLNALIKKHAEESLYLEFKSNGSLHTSDPKKNEIAKDVSAFANSDGGILIYGLNEVNHIADSFSFIDGQVYTKEWLENVIQSRINRRLQNFVVHPIRVGNDFAKTVYIVKIARSLQTPHMTSEKKYYRRLNFQVVQMEEYEIREAYNRTNKTNLSFSDLLITNDGSYMQAGRLSEARYKISFQIKNEGTTIENQYKLEVHIPTTLHTNPNPMQSFQIRKDNDIVVYSIPNSSPLFQDELTSIGAFNLVFNSQTKVWLKQPIRSKLYFSGGTIEKSFLLNDKLLYMGNPIDALL